MDATLLRMAVAATGAPTEPLADERSWQTGTSEQIERLVSELHSRFRPDWRPFLLQICPHLEVAPQGSATLLPFSVAEGGEASPVVLVIEAGSPLHRYLFLSESAEVADRLRTLATDLM